MQVCHWMPFRACLVKRMTWWQTADSIVWEADRSCMKSAVVHMTRTMWCQYRSLFVVIVLSFMAGSLMCGILIWHARHMNRTNVQERTSQWSLAILEQMADSLIMLNCVTVITICPQAYSSSSSKKHKRNERAISQYVHVHNRSTQGQARSIFIRLNKKQSCRSLVMSGWCKLNEPKRCVSHDVQRTKYTLFYQCWKKQNTDRWRSGLYIWGLQFSYIGTCVFTRCTSPMRCT